MALRGKFNYESVWFRLFVIMLVVSVFGAVVVAYMQFAFRVYTDWGYYFQALLVVFLALLMMRAEDALSRRNQRRSIFKSDEKRLSYLHRALMWTYVKPYVAIVVGWGTVWAVAVFFWDLPRFVVILLAAIALYSFGEMMTLSTTRRTAQLKEQIRRQKADMNPSIK